MWLFSVQLVVNTEQKIATSTFFLKSYDAFALRLTVKRKIVDACFAIVVA